MAFVQIPLSNTLRMVRTDNQSSNLPNFSNRLLWQEDYVDYYDRPYAQKIKDSDTFLIQFATDYTTITAKIYDNTDTLVSDKTSSITTNVTSTTFTIYDLEFTFAVTGYYYLVIDFDSSTEIYKSEVFQIYSTEDENLLKIEYNTSDNDGITYNNSQTFVIRLEGRMVEYDPGQNKETYTNYDESLVNLNSYPIRKFKLEYGPVPRYMVEKLNLALAHEVFKVNDVEYQADGGPDTDILSDGVWVHNLYKGGVTLQEVDYENYVLATDDSAPDTFKILIDSGTSVLLFRESGTDYNAIYKD